MSFEPETPAVDDEQQEPASVEFYFEPPLSVPPWSSPAEEENPRKSRGCVTTILALLLALSLVASSIYSVVWFLQRGNGRATEADSLPAVRSQPALPATQEAAAKDQAPSLAEQQPAPDSQADSAPTLNRIVLVNLEGQIETVGADGNSRHLLTSAGQRYQFPAWSPDGQSIAAVGSDGSGGGIYLLRDDDEEQETEPLYFSRQRAPFYLYWSPDSTRISFLANYPGEEGIGLNLVHAYEEGEAQLIATGSPLYWNWTADSELMLIHSGTLAEEARLGLIDDQGRLRSPLVSAPGFFQAPGISASGRYWAYSQLESGGNSYLVVLDQATGMDHRERHAGSVALGWSPTEELVAFTSGEADGAFSSWGPLRLVDATSGEVRVLSSNLVMAFFWSPNGQKIVTLSMPARNGFEGGIEVRDSKPRRVARGGTLGASLQDMPHAFDLSVIDVKSGSGLKLAEVTPNSLFLTQFLLYFDQYALSHSLWSPASDAVVLPLIVDNEPQIMVISTESGRMYPLGEGQMAFWSWQ